MPPPDLTVTVTEPTTAARAANSPMSPGFVPELIGVGSPLVDLVAKVSEKFLSDHVQGAKGGMEMVDAQVITHLLGKLKNPPAQSPGGSAANTTVGCAHLGVRASFIGACGRDEYGEFYKESLSGVNCLPSLIEQADQPTGRVLSMVTPDSERTMRTCLGAAATLDPAYFTPAVFAGARIVILEGYSLFNHALARAVVAAAKQAGCQLALDLASFEVVRANRAVIDELLEGGIDIIFANEDEATAWNPAGPQAALEDLAGRTTLAAVKLGKAGALIAKGAQRVQVPAETVDAIDSTGAGDSWAAGFLSGYLRGLPLMTCGRLGAKCGAAVVQVMGAQLPRERWLEVKGYLDAWA